MLSSLADAGVLSGAESAGIFSKLERAGAFSSAEKLLPIADDLKLLSTAEKLLDVPAFALVLGAGGLVAGGACLAARALHTTHPLPLPALCRRLAAARDGFRARTVRLRPLTRCCLVLRARAEVALITELPDDLLAVKVATAALAGVASVTLLAVSALFGLLQGSD